MGGNPKGLVASDCRRSDLAASGPIGAVDGGRGATPPPNDEESCILQPATLGCGHADALPKKTPPRQLPHTAEAPPQISVMGTPAALFAPTANCMGPSIWQSLSSTNRPARGGSAARPQKRPPGGRTALSAIPRPPVASAANPRHSVASARAKRHSMGSTAAVCNFREDGCPHMEVGEAAGGRSRQFDEDLANRKRAIKVIQMVQRQSILIARKRSAMIAIVFVDLPFLLVRFYIWTLVPSALSAMWVKNVICIALNVMQYPLIKLKYKRCFHDVWQRLVEYRVGLLRTRGRLRQVPAEGQVNTGPVSRPSPAAPLAGVRAVLGSPEMLGAKESPFASPAQVREGLDHVSRKSLLEEKADARRQRRTVPGVCVHFWCLLLTFFLGWSLAKGERQLPLVFQR